MKSIVTQNKTNIGFPEITSEIQEIIAQSNRILVGSHISPDGDALGTQLAFAEYLRSLNKTVILVRDDVIPEKYNFLPGIEMIPLLDDKDEPLDIDAAVVLECPNLSRIGKAGSRFPEGVKLINIDHHIDNAEYGHIDWINNKASSVGEMTFEYFEQVGFPISKTVAENLFVAIMTDTGRFRFRSTRPRTMEIVAKLIEAGADPQKVTDLVYYNMHAPSMKLIGKVLNEIEYSLEGKVCLLSLTQKMLADTGSAMSDSEGIIDFTLTTSGVEVGVFLKEHESKITRASLRSRKEINVAAIAAHFGGGGHFNAAGCSIELPILEAKKVLTKLFAEALDVS